MMAELAIDTSGNFGNGNNRMMRKGGGGEGGGEGGGDGMNENGYCMILELLRIHAK